jgi:hypothetical protein
MYDNSPYELIPFEGDINHEDSLQICQFGFTDDPGLSIDVSFYQGDNPYILVAYIYDENIGHEQPAHDEVDIQEHVVPRCVYYILHHPTIPLHMFTIRNIISVISPDCIILKNGYSDFHCFDYPNIDFYEYIDSPICAIPSIAQFNLSLT